MNVLPPSICVVAVILLYRLLFCLRCGYRAMNLNGFTQMSKSWRATNQQTYHVLSLRHRPVADGAVCIQYGHAGRLTSSVDVATPPRHRKAYNTVAILSIPSTDWAAAASAWAWNDVPSVEYCAPNKPLTTDLSDVSI